MGQRLIITEEERTRIAGMYEQSSNAKRVGGPFSVKPNDDEKYYIFRDGSKFYIYMTNASQKEPKLFGIIKGKVIQTIWRLNRRLMIY